MLCVAWTMSFTEESLGDPVSETFYLENNVYKEDVKGSLRVTSLLRYRYNAPAQGYVGPKTSCTETFGMVPETANGIHYEWNNTGRTYRCKPSTCNAACTAHNGHHCSICT